jgi:RNA polymerase sigma factor (sigma-70 family)
VSIEQPSEAGEESASFAIVDMSLNPEQICDRSQQYKRMLRAIDRLDPKMRSVVAIWIAKGCSMKEVAHSLDVSLASAKARFHRARKRLSRYPV